MLILAISQADSCNERLRVHQLFLSVFSVVVSPTTPIFIKVMYGVWMAFATTLWFSSLTYLFSLSSVRNLLSRSGHWFDRVMGVLLVGLGIKLGLVEIHNK